MKMQMQVLEKKVALESSMDSFIADRTTIDNLVYALYWLSREPEMQKGLKQYQVDCFLSCS